MKKLLIAFFAGVLMSALCAGLTACNEPKDPEQNEEGTEIQPVPVSEMSGEVADFFEGNADLIGRAIFYEQNDWENRKFVDACVTINSAEKFDKIDFRGETPPELPAIEFDSQTLVIGQWIGAQDARFYLMKQSLVTKDNTMTITLTIGEDIKSPWYTYLHLTPKYFWGLYPKIDAETINTIVERNYNIND
jgi:hypothetical protein